MVICLKYNTANKKRYKSRIHKCWQTSKKVTDRIKTQAISSRNYFMRHALVEY